MTPLLRDPRPLPGRSGRRAGRGGQALFGVVSALAGVLLLWTVYRTKAEEAGDLRALKAGGTPLDAASPAALAGFEEGLRRATALLHPLPGPLDPERNRTRTTQADGLVLLDEAGEPWMYALETIDANRLSDQDRARTLIATSLASGEVRPVLAGVRDFQVILPPLRLGAAPDRIHLQLVLDPASTGTSRPYIATLTLDHAAAP